jgi:hypothetical protein
MTTPRTIFRRRAGFLMPDIVFGLTVGLMVLMAMSVSLSQYHHTSRRLAQHREAAALAERVLTDLQIGQTPPPAPSGFTVQVRDLSARPPLPSEGPPDSGWGEGTPGSSRWVQVQVQIHGPAGQVLLTGMVPTTAKRGPP